MHYEWSQCPLVLNAIQVCPVVHMKLKKDVVLLKLINNMDWHNI